jgi:hypothetical protein
MLRCHAALLHAPAAHDLTPASCLLQQSTAPSLHARPEPTLLQNRGSNTLLKGTLASAHAGLQVMHIAPEAVQGQCSSSSALTWLLTSPAGSQACSMLRQEHPHNQTPCDHELSRDAQSCNLDTACTCCCCCWGGICILAVLDDMFEVNEDRTMHRRGSRGCEGLKTQEFETELSFHIVLMVVSGHPREQRQLKSLHSLG